MTTIEATSPCWFVGAMSNRGDDQTERFINEGIWEHDFDDNSRVLAQVRSMQPGERMAIKAVFVRKHNLSFETWCNPVSVMAIKAIGTITENRGDGRRVSVSWELVSPQREWYFYTHPSIWKVTPGKWKTDALIDFTFQSKPQDIDRFRNAPYWRERFGTDPQEHKRFRWARFYQAFADGLLSHSADRGPIISFLEELQPKVEGLGLLRGDQFADGSKGFIKDIDPFTLLGLFNRGIKDSNRQAIAAALAQFLGVEEALPESFEGIPVLNNQKSWFFPYAKDRDPAQIDALWQVFQSGLALAEADTEQAIEAFSRDFDAAMGYYGVAWNLTFGLYWCRPWSFLSLDERSRSYIGDKLRLTIGRNGAKQRCSAADYLQLIDALKQRFEEPDFSVHSFPELSLEAWTYTGSVPDPAGGESDDDVPAVSDGNDTPDVEPVTPLMPYGINDIVADGCFLAPSELERILRRLRDKKNLILQGPPGTGKTWLAKRLGMALVGHLVQEPQLRSVQFHPNLSYEDFVRGWRPNANGGLALHEGVFMQMVKGAQDNPSQTYVLVIEEINRGNPAQIFGELLTLLEAGKRTPRDAMQLCYPDPDGVHRPVHVPENLYVIGTMNIADRSLALVDMAFRRRFAFVDLEPCLGTTWRDWVVGSMQLEASAADTIQQRLEQLNSTISADSRLGKAFRIGHSTVTPSHSLDGRSSRDWFAEVVATELRPLLHEYWFDAPDVAEREADRLLEGW